MLPEKGMIKATKTKRKKEVDPKILEILKYRLRYEYDLYNFIKGRFYKLYGYLHNKKQEKLSLDKNTTLRALL